MGLIGIIYVTNIISDNRINWYFKCLTCFIWIDGPNSNRIITVAGYRNWNKNLHHLEHRKHMPILKNNSHTLMMLSIFQTTARTSFFCYKSMQPICLGSSGCANVCVMPKNKLIQLIPCTVFACNILWLFCRFCIYFFSSFEKNKNLSDWWLLGLFYILSLEDIRNIF